MNFLFIFLTVSFFNNYKSNKKYFIFFFLFSAPFLLAIERANTDVLIFLILYLLCKYKNIIQNYFFILLSYAAKIYPICFGILFFLKKVLKKFWLVCLCYFFLLVFFCFFKAKSFLKLLIIRLNFLGQEYISFHLGV